MKKVINPILLGLIIVALSGYAWSSERDTHHIADPFDSIMALKGCQQINPQDLPDKWRFLADEPSDRVDGMEQPPSEKLTMQSNRLLSGDYIFSSQGAFVDFVVGITDIQSTIGGFQFNGQGQFTGFQTARTLLRSRRFDTFTGTYSVDSSGAGSIFFSGGQRYNIILVKDGDAFFFADVNSSNFRESGYAQKLN